MQRSVFRVATDLIRVSGESSISAVKLQKLVYYTFGWYGRLTHKELFSQTFYAMEHGPVVSELLAAHSGQPSVTADVVEASSRAFADTIQDPDPYYDAVLSAIMRTYGKVSPWDLRDLSHDEEVWQQAWDERGRDRRADLPRDVILAYFIQRSDIPPELAKLLPDPQVTTVDEQTFETLETLQVDPPERFIKALQLMGVA